MLGRSFLDIDFADEAGWFGYRRSGWSFTESDGTWAEGFASDLVVPEPAAAACYTLLLTVAPYLGGTVALQRIVVRVDGAEVGSFSVADLETLACEVPDTVLRRNGRMEIAFEQPDAARPCDVSISDDRRLLGLMHSRLVLRRSIRPQGTASMSGIRAAALLSRFESLGDTCEFSFLQRRYGVEPIGLFHFAGMRLHRLIEALEDDFAALGDPDHLRIMNGGRTESRDIYHQRYGYIYHSFHPDEELRTPEFLRREAGRLRFLWRILKGDFRAAAKIFVIRSGDGVSEHHMRLLMAKLRRYGDVTLLWVVEASHATQVGQVVHLGEHLLKGYIAYLTSSKAYDFADESWLQVCAEAELLATRLELLAGIVHA